MQTESLKLLLSTREAARALGVSTRTLWSLTFNRRPGLPHVRIGRRVMYRLSDLEAWIERNRIASPAEGQTDAG